MFAEILRYERLAVEHAARLKRHRKVVSELEKQLQLKEAVAEAREEPLS
jgi:hypothetical protein